jgi:hypothetical protein
MSSGGSANLKVGRHRKPRQNNAVKLESALKTAHAKYGKEEIGDFVLTYSSITTTESEEDGILMSCINLGMSDIQMKATFHVGGSRLTRLRQRIKEGDDYKIPVKAARSHAFSEDTINFLREQMDKWPVEEGFPCAHRRPVQYLLNENNEVLNWSSLHRKYEV